MIKKTALVATLALSGCTADKVLHMGAGAAVGGVTRSCEAAWVAGIGKELYDATGAGTVDPMDAIATGLAGCLIAYALEG